MRTTSTREVVTCTDCNGMGSILKDPGHRSIKYDVVTCPTCSGEGRMIKVTRVEYMPLKREKGLMVRI